MVLMHFPHHPHNDPLVGGGVHIGDKIHFPFFFPINSTGTSFHLTHKVPTSASLTQSLLDALCVVSSGTAAVYFTAI
jgi:hypothetical protein